MRPNSKLFFQISTTSMFVLLWTLQRVRLLTGSGINLFSQLRESSLVFLGPKLLYQNKCFSKWFKTHWIGSCRNLCKVYSLVASGLQSNEAERSRRNARADDRDFAIEFRDYNLIGTAWRTWLNRTGSNPTHRLVDVVLLTYISQVYNATFITVQN